MILPHTSESNPVIVCGADDAYCRPLAVTFKSLRNHLSSLREADVYVIDGGITDENRSCLRAALGADDCVRLHWIEPDWDALAGLTVSAHVSHAAYFRILIPRLLPRSVRRVLYIDSDLLFKRDIGELWNLEMGDNLALAAQDQAAPYIDCLHSIPDKQEAHQKVAALTPIMNYRDLGISSGHKYFNSGLMLIDVEGWRREHIEEQLLQCLHEHKDYVLWWDQYALNVVLAGRWGKIDPRWNQGTAIFTYDGYEGSPFDRETYESLVNDPYVVHFTSHIKPWHTDSDHPHREEFFECLDQTPYAGWRPRWAHNEKPQEHSLLVASWRRMVGLLART